MYRTFILFLLSAALLFGCGKTDREINTTAVSSSAASARPVQKLPAPAPSDEKTREDVTDSLKNCACTDASDIYDLTSLCSQEKASLLGYGMFDQKRVLLLYLSASGKTYRAVLLDLAQKSMTQIAAWKNATDRQDYNYLRVLSCSPLVVLDTVSDVIYRPGTDVQEAVACSESDTIFSDSAPVSDDGNPTSLSSDMSVQCLDGTVYLSDSDGFLRELTKDGSLREVFSLPYTYSYFTPVYMDDDGRLTFLTYPETDSSQAVFMAVDPKTGRYDTYTCDTQSFYDTQEDGYLFSTYYESYPAFTVSSRDRKCRAVRTLPQSIAEKLEIKPDADGNYPSDGGDAPILATCTLPEAGDLCLFSLDDSYGSGACALYLMDLSRAAWEAWTPPEKISYAPETADYGSLSDRARELEKKYGLKIVMGTNVPTSFNDYDTVQVTDESRISDALGVIGDALAVYPEGFFENVADGYYRDIAIYLTGTLTPHDASSHISDAGGFTTESGGLAEVAFDIDYDLDRGTIIHEMTHVLDYRLEGTGEIDDDEWNEMNPEGFHYYYSYIDADGNSYEYTGSTEYTPLSETDPNRIWFADVYSKTFPMEDRARLMEYLLRDKDSAADYYSGNPIQTKLDWYFRLIRRTVGNDSWPEETSWEKALKTAAESAQ